MRSGSLVVAGVVAGVVCEVIAVLGVGVWVLEGGAVIDSSSLAVCCPCVLFVCLYVCVGLYVSISVCAY